MTPPRCDGDSGVSSEYATEVTGEANDDRASRYRYPGPEALTGPLVVERITVGVRHEFGSGQELA